MCTGSSWLLRITKAGHCENNSEMYMYKGYVHRNTKCHYDYRFLVVKGVARRERVCFMFSYFSDIPLENIRRTLKCQ